MATLPGGENTIPGTAGDDVLTGTPLDDLIRGGPGADYMDGFGGDDFLMGAPGNDTLIGGTGVDYLLGGAGDDLLTGGGGGDQFRFYANLIPGGTTDYDTITDLDFAEGDLILLANFSKGTFHGTDIKGQLDLVDSGPNIGSGANIRNWAGMVDLVDSSPAVTAEQLGMTDTLLLKVVDGSRTQIIAIQNGWSKYSGLTNTAPVAADDAASVQEDAAVTGNVLANDSDPDAGDTISVSSAKPAAGSSQPVPSSGSVTLNGAYGSLTLGASGTYSYLAANGAAQALAAGQVVQDVFSYTITDSGGKTSTAQLVITVTGTNDAPVAQALSGTVSENGPAISFTPDFQDVDAGDTHSFSVNTAGTAGMVTMSGGTFSYDPNGKFESLKTGQTATDTFTYTVTDNNGASSTETVTVTIAGQNDDPTAMADYNGVVKNGSISVPASRGVLVNDGDIEGDSLSVAALNGSPANVGTAVQGKYGALTMNPDGGYSYVANTRPGALPSKIVAQDHFTYTVSDGNGGTQTETLTITVYNKGQTYHRGTDGGDALSGGNGSDVLDGGNGNDVLIGGNGPDALLGGRGNDVMTGGSGPDTFVFNEKFGQDAITDFIKGDAIQFDKAVFASYADVLGSAVQSGNNVVIDAGGGNVLTLEKMLLSNLQSSDFLFV